MQGGGGSKGGQGKGRGWGMQLFKAPLFLVRQENLQAQGIFRLQLTTLNLFGMLCNSENRIDLKFGLSASQSRTPKMFTTVASPTLCQHTVDTQVFFAAGRLGQDLWYVHTVQLSSLMTLCVYMCFSAV